MLQNGGFAANSQAYVPESLLLFPARSHKDCFREGDYVVGLVCWGFCFLEVGTVALCVCTQVLARDCFPLLFVCFKSWTPGRPHQKLPDNMALFFAINRHDSTQ